MYKAQDFQVISNDAKKALFVALKSLMEDLYRHRCTPYPCKICEDVINAGNVKNLVEFEIERSKNENQSG